MAQTQGVPILEGTSILPDLAAAVSAANEVGFPLLLKSTAGGGGIGMQRCDSARDLEAAFESVTALAKSNFTSPGVFLEKCITNARHVEVQLFGDGRGRSSFLGTATARCSVAIKSLLKNARRQICRRISGSLCTIVHALWRPRLTTPARAL